MTRQDTPSDGVIVGPWFGSGRKKLATGTALTTIVSTSCHFCGRPINAFITERLAACCNPECEKMRNGVLQGAQEEVGLGGRLLW